MYRPSRDSSAERRRGPPSLGVSFAFLAAALGVIGLGYAIAAAPVLVAAFAAGVVTAAVVSIAIWFREAEPFPRASAGPEPIRR